MTIKPADVINATEAGFIEEICNRWNSHEALVKIKELAYEVACTGDQQASDKLISLIEDFEAAIAAADKKT